MKESANTAALISIAPAAGAQVTRRRSNYKRTHKNFKANCYRPRNETLCSWSGAARGAEHMIKRSWALELPLCASPLLAEIVARLLILKRGRAPVNDLMTKDEPTQA